MTISRMYELSQDKLDEVIKLYEQGISINTLSRMLRNRDNVPLHEKIIRQFLVDHGVIIRNRHEGQMAERALRRTEKQI